MATFIKLSKSHLNMSLPLILFVFSFTVMDNVCGYNLSPKPNVIVKDPQLATTLPKVQSSYFGFSLSLRPKGVIVGAPRAQSTLPPQRHVNETGAIYRCSIAERSCAPYVFDKDGNVDSEVNDYTYNSEKRDNQWLGASMDGGTSDNDKLLVCAPRFIAKAPNDYLLHGLCYWINDTLSKDPENVKKISPLRLKTEQVKERDHTRFYYYMLAEQGLSAHVSANNEEFLIGAPGIHTWKGSVIRYHKKYLTDDPSLSRRDVHGVRVTREVQPGEGVRFTYESEVPNPEKWEQPNDSYFGYSVGSGHFDSMDKEKLLYVATAPQANLQSGEAYIFDVSGDSISKKYTFRGQQFGEYFGYAVLAEDVNGDGITDVIISAPQHSKTGSFDDGAIYVFINQGRSQFSFEQKLLVSPVHGKARFGTTLTKLGDINHDGYNDIAVGAPFIGNGAVFIYLGGANGLREQHSQRLDSPKNLQTIYGTHMFGHGLAKGADIDNNGFNDLAVGAPNAEAVFIYRAYPVVRIVATVKSTTREIKPEQSHFKISVCYGIQTTSSAINHQDLSLRVVVDPNVKRVKLSQSHANELSFNVSAGRQQQCVPLDCEVRYSVQDIFKPIELEVHYNVIKGIPDSETFCEACAAVDPAEPKVFSEKIIFSTGCASDICVADLQVKSSGLDSSYILGSSRNLKVAYEIRNVGETAYLPQINITSSNRMPFAKIPSNCRTDNIDYLICDLNNGQPMANGAKDYISLIYDASNIYGKSMTLTARVFSTGREATPDNNVATDVITLKEFTEVEVVGTAVTPHINLEKTFNTAQIINNYEIKSNGPSTVGAMEVTFYIPVAYKVAGSSATISIIDMNNITMQAVYDSQLIGIDYYQNNTQLLMNTIEISSSTTSATEYTRVVNDMQHAIHYDTVKMGIFENNDADHSLSDSVMTASMSRKRRNALAQTATKEQYARIVKAHDLLSEDLKGTLPVNRTIVFNCNDPEMTICVRAVLRVYNFKPDKPITVTMKYQADLKEINQILIEPWEFFVILIGAEVTKLAANDAQSLAVTKKIEYNIVSKHQLYHTPIWVYILAALGGLLLLAAITYGMYKAGFFKRTTKEEMDALMVNQGQVAPGEAETDNLNAGNH